MKNLLILPLLLLLTSCVTYYTPETAMENGVYYAEDDPAYVVFQGGYPGAAYYPWLSLDYFYMGYHPYPTYSYYYGFPFGLGFAYRYPYGYWVHYGGYCAHDRVCGGRIYDNQRSYGQNRYADNDASDSNYSDGGESGEEGIAGQYLDELKSVGVYGPSYGRHVSTMPTGYGGNRGMVIGHNGSTKISDSKVQPVASTGSSNGIIVTAAPPANASDQSARQRFGTTVISKRPAQTIVSRGPSRSSNSSGRSTARVSSGRSNQSRSSGRSSGSRSTKSSRSVRRDNRD